MEQEGAMSSSEYHKCMSETYYTRALMFAMFSALFYGQSGMSPTFWILVSAAVLNGIESILQLRKVSHG